MDKIINTIAGELNVKPKQVEAAINLIDEGNTIPFIARYRKEVTGGLSDEVLRDLGERLTYLRNLEERKQEVIKSIDSQGKLTDEIVKNLEQSKTIADVEDIYRPYKQKKRTRATIAKEKGLEELAKIILDQQAKGVNNINLVTPTMYAHQIIEALKIAKANGLHIPVIYNTNGYENVETIKMLAGYIDVYLPDLKYYSNELSTKYSKADNYFKIATTAIQEMQKQVGILVFNENGIIQKGVIIRHLVLPNHIQNSKHILKWIKENMPEGTYVSVMAQYFPTYKAKEDRLLNRKLSKKEYKEIENYLYTLELENGYIQELGEHEEEYVPDFNMHM